MTATAMTAEELTAHRDEVGSRLSSLPLFWQKVLPPARCSVPSWQEGVWVAWGPRGELAALIGASGGYWPKFCVYPALVELELSEEQFERLIDLFTAEDDTIVAA